MVVTVTTLCSWICSLVKDCVSIPFGARSSLLRITLEKIALRWILFLVIVEQFPLTIKVLFIIYVGNIHKLLVGTSFIISTNTLFRVPCIYLEIETFLPRVCSYVHPWLLMRNYLCLSLPHKISLTFILMMIWLTVSFRLPEVIVFSIHVLSLKLFKSYNMPLERIIFHL